MLDIEPVALHMPGMYALPYGSSHTLLLKTKQKTNKNKTVTVTQSLSLAEWACLAKLCHHDGSFADFLSHLVLKICLPPSEVGGLCQGTLVEGLNGLVPPFLLS